MKKKSVLALLLCLIMVLAMCLTACGGNADAGGDADVDEDAYEGKVIAYCANSLSSTSENDCGNTIKEYFEARGATVYIEECGGDADLQYSQVENYITMGVDLIVMLPYDSFGMSAAVRSANEAGIPVLVIYSALAPEDNCVTDVFITQDPFDMGYQVGKMASAWIDENYPDAGEGEIHVALLYPNVVDTLEQRGLGMQAAIDEDPRMQVTFIKNNDQSAEEAQIAAEEALAQDPDIKIFMCWESMLPVGIDSALKGVTSDLSGYGVFCINYDSTISELLEMSKEDDSALRGTIVLGAYNYGDSVVTVIEEMFAGEHEPGTILYDELIPCTAE